AGSTLDGILEKWQFVEHHLTHEASAFLASPYDETAVLTMDGRGERASTSYGHYRDGRYERIKQINLPHSLGLLYEEVTRYLGFLHSSDEYKVMALASYGKPLYVSEFREIVQGDGAGGYTLQDTKLTERFGLPRRRGERFEQKHMDIAHSLQCVLEETVLAMAHWLHGATGSDRLCMAGGVALNCVMNARLAAASPFRDIWVQPAAGDAGTSLGAALWVDMHQREGGRQRFMEHAYLGPEYSDEEIEAFLNYSGLHYTRLTDIAKS